MPREPLPSLQSRRKSSTMHTVRHTPAMEYKLQGVKVKSLLLCYHESMIMAFFLFDPSGGSHGSRWT